VALRIDPGLIRRLAAGLSEGVVVVTGTNGKTTTTKMLVEILRGAGKRVITNPTGSNLARGIATRLIEVVESRGSIPADVAVFEVDEAAIRALGSELTPRMVVVTNLARDQLDRYGELNTTASHIGAALAHTATAVLNNDDPLVAGLAGSAAEDRRFGAVASIRERMPDDRSLYGAAGDAPPSGDLDLTVETADPEGDGLRLVMGLRGGARLTVELQVPGVFNAYNAAAAALAAITLGVDPEAAARALEEVGPAWGRGQLIPFRGRSVRVLLVKNPAGFNQAVHLLREVPRGAPILIAINDLIADGRDVSWLWDARVEALAGAGHRVATTGIRALDMAVRLKYAGIEAWWETEFGAALDRFIDEVPEGETAYIVPTYTAMLTLLEMLLPGTHRTEAWS
jgi:UDP-N-acetylmuramyl tripeptide synthase